MDQDIMVVGLDVHKKAITAAILPPTAVRPVKTFTLENRPKAIARLVTDAQGRVVFVYEAGPCGYEVHRQITTLGGRCVVIAPGLTPVRPGDRVKTNRRDAEKLARLYRAGELTEIRVPTRLEEAARDLVRIREDAVEDRLRARHRLNKFLLRQGRVYEGKAWTLTHCAWLRAQRFDWPPLQQTLEGYLRALDEFGTQHGLARATREHHQGRERPHPADSRGGGMELPASQHHKPGAGDAPPRVPARGGAHREGGAGSAAPEVLAPRQPRQALAGRGGRGRPRAGGVCLGDCPARARHRIQLIERSGWCGRSVVVPEARPRYGEPSRALCGAQAIAWNDPRA
jgi:hypothetical protein